jgi:hypothetical protein
MNVRFLAAALAASLLLAPSLAFAWYGGAVLTPAQKRAYHTCLYASYIENYCRWNAWGSSLGAFRECIIANRAGRVRPGYPFWGWGVENICRELIQTGSR